MIWSSAGTSICDFTGFYFLFTSLVSQEVEMEHFKENRDQLLKTYENLLKKEKEDTDRYKHDVQCYQQMFLKNTPTPNKSQYEVSVMNSPVVET
jgi:hypothetical protein